MGGVRAEEVVARVNECINRRDLVGLDELMTDDHVFTDSELASGEGSRIASMRGAASSPNFLIIGTRSHR
jgi:hypothetical protein